MSLMREDYGKRGIELNESRLKMATLPKPSEVWHLFHTRDTRGPSLLLFA